MFKTAFRSAAGVCAGIAAAAVLTAAPALAQTTQFRSYRDATIRGGTSASLNFGADPVLEVRASSDPEYLRRAVLMFNTESTLPSTTTVGSAQLVLTVKTGNPETRTLTACALPVSFDEPTVTWTHRNASTKWANAGGDVAAECSHATITDTPNSHVTFDVTAAVRKAVAGAYGSRYARFVVGDSGGSSRDSYKQVYSNQESNSAVRPLLIVTTGTATSTSASDITLKASAFRPHGKWAVQSDGSVRHPDAGAAKLSAAASSPANYVDTTFQAQAGVGYRIWLHGHADRDYWGNDSVFVQFSGSTTSGGSAQWRIGTTSATAINLEACDGCGLSGWAWQDDGWGSPSALGPLVYFAASGTQTIRIQTREDGLAFDKVVLSPTTYLSKPPAAYSLSSSTAPVEETTDPEPPASTTTTSSTLRVLQWNSHHGGYGTDGVYDPNRLVNWIVKMNPDIISLNEVEYYTGWGNEDQPARFAALLKQKTGRTWYYKFATASGAAKGDGNLILSRYPFDIKDSVLLSYTRVVVQVAVNVNGRNISFFSTHLDDGSTSAREAEIRQLQTWASGIAEQRIIAGDFNAWPGTPEDTMMLAKYYDSWAEAAKKGTAIGYPGNTDGRTRNTRIDYIWYSHGASALSLQRVQVFDTRDANGVMPSDHRPVLATFTVR